MSAADELRAMRATPAPPTPDQLDDIGNGLRFADRWRGEAVFVPGFRCWYTWDARRWARDLEGVRTLEQMAQEIVQAIRAEASDAFEHATMGVSPELTPDELKEQKRLLKRGMELLGHANASSRRLGAMLDRARGHDGMTVPVERLDAELHVLNCSNGIVDLRDGSLAAHDPKRWMTKLTAVAYDPDAECPQWDEFLQAFTGHDPELAGWLQRLVGLAASGNTGHRVLPVLNGHGGTGKTTFVETLTRVLGEYAVTGDAAVILSEKRESGASEEIAMLHGARLVGLPDLPAGVLNASRVKRLTGGDSLTARRLYAHLFTFQPSHTFLLDCNVKPKVREHTQAVWDRVRLIPCEHRFVGPGHVDRDEMRERFDSEAEGILVWIVRGAMLWHDDGLGYEPHVVRAATASYKATEDLLAQWIEDRCDTSDSEVWTTSKTLRESFEGWAEDAGYKEDGKHRLNASWFSRNLTEHGYEARKRNGIRGILGLGLKGGA
jgi:putative DNA primase/helicase